VAHMARAVGHAMVDAEVMIEVIGAAREVDADELGFGALALERDLEVRAADAAGERDDAAPVQRASSQGDADERGREAPILPEADVLEPRAVGEADVYEGGRGAASVLTPEHPLDERARRTRRDGDDEPWITHSRGTRARDVDELEDRL